MSWDRIQGHWKDLTGSVKQEWSRLSEEQIRLLNGEKERLAGLIREVYGSTRAEAEKQVVAWQAAQAGALDKLELKWKHLVVDVKHHWGKLSQQQLDAAAGNRDKLVALIQEHYGKAREEVEAQLNALEKHQQATWEKVEQDWQELRGSVQETWSRLSQEQIKAIGGQREKLVSTVREVYGSTREAVERQVAEWGDRLKK